MPKPWEDLQLERRKKKADRRDLLAGLIPFAVFFGILFFFRALLVGDFDSADRMADRWGDALMHGALGALAGAAISVVWWFRQRDPDDDPFEKKKLF